MSSSSILLENPKGDNQSWEDWGTQLAEKYKTPADTPGLPIAPGQAALRKCLSIPVTRHFRSELLIAPLCEQLRPGPSTATSGRTTTTASLRHPPSLLPNKRMVSPSSPFLLTPLPAPLETHGLLGVPPSAKLTPSTARQSERSTTQISSLPRPPPTVTGPTTVTSGPSTAGNSLRRSENPPLNLSTLVIAL